MKPEQKLWYHLRVQPLEEPPEVLLRILQRGRYHLLDTLQHLPGPGHHLGVGGGARAVRGEIVAIGRRTISRAIGAKVVGA